MRISLVSKEVLYKGKFKKVKDLPIVRNIKIVFKCDYCNNERSMAFRTYLKRHSGNLDERDICIRCRHKLRKEKNIIDRMKKRWKYVHDVLKKVGMQLVSSKEEIYGKWHCKVICEKHKNKGVITICDQTMLRAAKGQKVGCKYCKAEKAFGKYGRSGEQNPNWKGGVKELREYLRQYIYPWVYDSLKSSNFKCIITNSNKDNVIHHRYPFHKIFDEVFDELKLPIKEHIGDYTLMEMKNIRQTCLKLHYKYGLGVCIDRELHKLFHSKDLYGNKYFTSEDFDEFIYQQRKHYKYGGV